MARNGAGTYVLPAGQPVVTGTTISSTVHNTLATDLANALTTSIATDGQSVVTANIPFAGYKLTGLGAATVNGDALRYENLGLLQAQTYTAFTTGGTSTAYTGSPTPAITAYAAGQSFWVTFNAASGAAPTLQISGVATPPNLVKQIADGTYANVAANDIPLNHRSRVTLLSATQALVDLPSAAAKYITTLPDLGAGGLPDNSVLTADIANAQITAEKLSGAQTGSAPIYGNRAWVNFDGTGAVAIRGSGNVSSITDNGTGDYTINFTTAMPHADYATGFGYVRSLGARTAARTITIHTQTTTSLRVNCQDQSGFAEDFELVSCVVTC